MYVSFNSTFGDRAGVFGPGAAGWAACAGRGAGTGPVAVAKAGLPIVTAASAAANPVIVRIMMAFLRFAFGANPVYATKGAFRVEAAEYRPFSGSRGTRG